LACLMSGTGTHSVKSAINSTRAIPGAQTRISRS